MAAEKLSNLIPQGDFWGIDKSTSPVRLCDLPRGSYSLQEAVEEGCRRILEQAARPSADFPAVVEMLAAAFARADAIRSTRWARKAARARERYAKRKPTADWWGRPL